MAQKGAGRRGRPLNPDLGYAGDPVHHATADVPPQRIGIRELRQQASVYVDLVERGYTIDITNRGRLVAQLIPVRDPESPLERWIAGGVIERAEDEGSILEVDPYPVPAGSPASGTPSASPLPAGPLPAGPLPAGPVSAGPLSASAALAQLRAAEA